jgi:hypothetical protein
MSKLQSRSLVGALLLSIAINILAVGMFIGRHNAGPAIQPNPAQLGWILRGMDRETRKSIRPLMKQQLELSKPLREQMQASRHQLADAISAEPFAEVRSASVAFQQSSHEHLATIIASLDSEDRLQLLEALKHHQQPPRRHSKAP